jgi:hypothetical protein
MHPFVKNHPPKQAETPVDEPPAVRTDVHPFLRKALPALRVPQEKTEKTISDEPVVRKDTHPFLKKALPAQRVPQEKPEKPISDDPVVRKDTHPFLRKALPAQRVPQEKTEKPISDEPAVRKDAHPFLRKALPVQRVPQEKPTEPTDDKPDRTEAHPFLRKALPVQRTVAPTPEESPLVEDGPPEVLELEVTTSPKGCNLEFEGEKIGQAPQTLRLTEGKIKASKEGYVSRTLKIGITSDNPLQIKLKKRPAPPAFPPVEEEVVQEDGPLEVRIEVITSPKGCNLELAGQKVDDRDVCQAPHTFLFTDSVQRQLKISKTGYISKTRKIGSTSDNPLKIKLRKRSKKK